MKKCCVQYQTLAAQINAMFDIGTSFKKNFKMPNMHIHTDQQLI